MFWPSKHGVEGQKQNRKRQQQQSVYLQGGDDLVGHLLDGDHVAAGLRVDDALLLLPAHHDGLLTVCRAAHLLLLALRRQRGVGVRRDHGRDWGERPQRGGGGGGEGGRGGGDLVKMVDDCADSNQLWVVKL